ncbi:MAG: DNA primase, partial [Coleofasciculus sp. C3-bin4]|nr:DNA primase [Coleofasciculus sp. C3-bin4]
MQSTEFKTFDIREHVDKLTPAKGKNRYYCPICEKNDLTINPNSGEYRCWHGCECPDIREAIAPRQGSNKNNRVIRRKPKEVAPKSALIPEGEVKLARLPQPVEIPQRRKMGDCSGFIYPYSESQWVIRIELPDGKKQIRPYHINVNGEEIERKGDESWPGYRIAEVQAYGSSQWILVVEGEKCVEVARSLGLVAFTLQGGWSEKELKRAVIAVKEAGAKGIYCYPDHDKAGYEKASRLEAVANKHQVSFILADPALIWKECPAKGDIADWIEWGMERGWEKEEFVRRLKEQFGKAADRKRLCQEDENADQQADDGDSEELSIRNEFTQIVFDNFYADKPWISSGDKLYSWEGTYYKHSPDEVEIRRITDFCNG